MGVLVGVLWKERGFQDASGEEDSRFLLSLRSAGFHPSL